ncbi:polysaccharide lyase family 7 protein, partial [Azorhizophilus paspali]
MTGIDLSRWNLTIPTGKIVPTKDLPAYKSQYFIHTAEFIRFVVPHGFDGAGTTPNSKYLRSELRETLPNGDDNEANWKIGSAPLHALVATCQIDSFAASGKMIAGQIHGEGDKPPMKLQATRIAGTNTFEL